MEEVTVLWTSSDPCLWETVLQSLQQCWSTYDLVLNCLLIPLLIIKIDFSNQYVGWLQKDDLYNTHENIFLEAEGAKGLII